jgi:Zn-dependent peptidase ImmA (M78 family)
VFDRVIRGYEAAYAVPREIPAAAPMDATEARAVLGQDFIVDVPGAVERAFGIHVIQADDVAGDCAIQVAGRRVILVGTTPNWFFRNWSIAHELGHILRGDLDVAVDSAAATAAPRTVERAANAFAAELLLPKGVLSARDWVAVGEKELADFVWRSGVSTTALGQRLASLKLETAPTVRRMLGTKTAAFVRRGSELAADPELRSSRAAESAAVRFPRDLLDAHLSGVAAGSMDAATLEWMLG